MAHFALFCIATENIFLVSEKTLRSVAKDRDESLPFSTRLRNVKRTSGWEKRMRCKEFAEEYEKRRKQFAKSLEMTHQIAKRLFITAKFLKNIAHVVEHEMSRAIILLCADILSARGKERKAWVDLTSYLILILATPSNLDLKQLGLNVQALSDFPDISIGFRTRNEEQRQYNLQLEQEFHDTPWISFQGIFNALRQIATGQRDLPDVPTSELPRAFLDTRSLIENGCFRAAVQHGAGDKLRKKFLAADELPELVQQYLSRLGCLQPPEKHPEPGRPAKVRVAWMREARIHGWGWKEFRQFYGYKSLDDAGKASLDEDIRRVLYKNPASQKPQK